MTCSTRFYSRQGRRDRSGTKGPPRTRREGCPQRANHRAESLTDRGSEDPLPRRRAKHRSSLSLRLRSVRLTPLVGRQDAVRAVGSRRRRLRPLPLACCASSDGVHRSRFLRLATRTREDRYLLASSGTRRGHRGTHRVGRTCAPHERSPLLRPVQRWRESRRRPSFRPAHRIARTRKPGPPALPSLDRTAWTRTERYI
jgi:hypothetical protein